MKILKRVLAAFMIVAMVLTLSPSESAEAATTKTVVSVNITSKRMYVKKTLQLKVNRARGVTIKSKSFS